MSQKINLRVWLKIPDAEAATAASCSPSTARPGRSTTRSSSRAIAQAGVPIWGITIQNEPMATQTWESCIYPRRRGAGLSEAIILGPTMSAQGLGDVKIIVWDHNRDLICAARSAPSSPIPAAAKYVWGIGFHWYEDWCGRRRRCTTTSRLVSRDVSRTSTPLHRGNGGPTSTPTASRTLEARRGLRPLDDPRFQRRAPRAGPTGTSCSTSRAARTTSATSASPRSTPTRGPGQLIYTNSYYYIGHFSKFVRPGARRIAAPRAAACCSRRRS